VNATLARCTPLHFSDGMAGAVAGRLIAIRFVDDRSTQNRCSDGTQSLGRCGPGAGPPQSFVIPAQKGACRVRLREP